MIDRIVKAFTLDVVQRFKAGGRLNEQHRGDVCSMLVDSLGTIDIREI